MSNRYVCTVCEKKWYENQVVVEAGGQKTCGDAFCGGNVKMIPRHKRQIWKFVDNKVITKRRRCIHCQQIQTKGQEVLVLQSEDGSRKAYFCNQDCFSNFEAGTNIQRPEWGAGSFR